MTSETSSRCAPDPTELLDRYRSIRRQTLHLCEPLEVEDYNLQSMAEASPVKWHLAHTTWFFETFVLESETSGYRPFDVQYRQLFNSYYAAVGDRLERGRRGLLSRPTLQTIMAYRRFVDDAMTRLLESRELTDDAAKRIVLGLHHEQQHQELILTDLKHAFSINPLRPTYGHRQGGNRKQPSSQAEGGAGNRRTKKQMASSSPQPMEWIEVEAGVRRVGYSGDDFCFDNEIPAHRVFLEPVAVATRLVTNGEFLEFMQNDGYRREELWLAAGWDAVRAHGWRAPLYWEKQDGDWQVFTLAGLQPLDVSEPVCHVSYFEADAYARWMGCVLPSEFEWEAFAEACPIEGNFVESGRFHPAAACVGDGPLQVYGDVWEWTRSAYAAYPGYQPGSGALGEYNGKFMSGQQVLRGGSCATPQSHIRATYRNFFPPEARWQFSGIRLTRSLDGKQ